jgi:hypothetical protein
MTEHNIPAHLPPFYHLIRTMERNAWILRSRPTRRALYWVEIRPEVPREERA